MKNLIYFNLGNNETFIDVLQLCLDTIERQCFDGDYLFITNYADKIKNKIKCKNKFYFLEIHESDLNPAFYRFKIHQFDKIHSYDKILYSDVDILYYLNPKFIFEKIKPGYISVSEDDSNVCSKEITLMTDKIDNVGWWGADLMNEDEKNLVNSKKICAISAGLFGFEKSEINFFEQLDKFISLNVNSINQQTLDQPFFNVFLLRNSNYNYNLGEFVTHNRTTNLFKPLVHFTGPTGNAENKFIDMKNFINKKINKLIYFTVSYNKDYINLLKFSVDSLIRNGYDGSFLFITNFKKDIQNKIEIANPMYFLDLQANNILDSAANKFCIYKFDKINSFDKILFSDVDMIFNVNPEIIFDMIIEDKIYVSNDNILENTSTKLMTDFWEGEYWWCNDLFENEEKNYIRRKKILAINSGIFAFNCRMINHFELMNEFYSKNKSFANASLEQSFFNLYLFRNNLINNKLSEIVTHNGMQGNIDKPIVHFAGQPGNFHSKMTMIKDNFNLSMANF